MPRKKKATKDEMEKFCVKQVSRNDFYVGEPPLWWVACNREFNSYYHLPCRETWENKVEVLDPKYREPICPACKKNLDEGKVMLLLTQRIGIDLPGSQSSS